jgi:7-cyano-7-deazaguanine synthase in queuosine biosynthesis
MKDNNTASLEKRLDQARDIETRYAQRATAEPDNFALQLGYRSFQQEVLEVKNLLAQAQIEKLASIRREQEVRRMTRNERLAAWSEYINFVLARLAAIAAIVVGTLKLIDARVLAIELPIPALFLLGAGLAVLLYRPLLSKLRGFNSKTR